DRQADEAAPAIAALLLGAAGARRVVATRAEGAIAGPGQHDDADRPVVLGIAHRAQHLLDGLGAERVQHLRAVDRDRRDPVALLEEDVLELHHRDLRMPKIRNRRCGGAAARASDAASTAYWRNAAMTSRVVSTPSPGQRIGRSSPASAY